MPSGDMLAAQRLAVVYLEPMDRFSSPHGSVREALLRDLPDLSVEMVGSSIGALYVRFHTPAERELAISRQPFMHEDVCIDLVREEDAERINSCAHTLALITTIRFPAEHVNLYGIATAFASFGEVLEIDPVILSGVDLSIVTVVVLLVRASDVPCDIWTHRAPWKGRVIGINVLRVWPKADSFNDAGEYRRFFGPPLLPPFAHNQPSQLGQSLVLARDPGNASAQRWGGPFGLVHGVMCRLLGWYPSMPCPTMLPCALAPTPASSFSSSAMASSGMSISSGSSTTLGGVTITELEDDAVAGLQGAPYPQGACMSQRAWEGQARGGWRRPLYERPPGQP
jgi:hypothetical protein